MYLFQQIICWEPLTFDSVEILQFGERHSLKFPVDLHEVGLHGLVIRYDQCKLLPTLASQSYCAHNCVRKSNCLMKFVTHIKT